MMRPLGRPRVVRFGLIACLLILAGMGAGSPGSAAQSAPPDRAGLVIVLPDQQPQSFCVALDGGEFTGMQLLERAGLDFVADYSSGMGAALCQVDGVGCAFPRQACFCQCQGAQCTYWSYHRLEPGSSGWSYAQFGASSSPIRPGGVDAWIWGSGEDASAQIQPPALTFAEICAGEMVSAQPDRGGANLAPYAGFAGLLLALLLGALVRRRAQKIPGPA